MDGGFFLSRPTSQRLADFWLSGELLCMLLRRWRGQWIKVELSTALEGRPADLPDDSRLLGVACSWERRAFLARFEHESFAEVPDGLVVPVLGELVLHVRPEEAAEAPLVVKGVR